MDTSFIVVDTGTGFHLASSNLKAVEAQTNSKGALAVLCNSILLLWKSVVESTDDKTSRDAPRAFAFEGEGDAAFNLPVRFFHAQGHVLCVVFSSKRHHLYELLAQRIAGFAHSGEVNLLKDQRTLHQIAEATFCDFVANYCRERKISNTAILVKGATSTFSFCVGQLKDVVSALEIYLNDSVAFGEYISGSLKCCVHTTGVVRTVLAMYGVSYAEFAEVAADDILLKWAAHLCPSTD